MSGPALVSAERPLEVEAEAGQALRGAVSEHHPVAGQELVPGRVVDQVHQRVQAGVAAVAGVRVQQRTGRRQGTSSGRAAAARAHRRSSGRGGQRKPRHDEPRTRHRDTDRPRVPAHPGLLTSRPSRLTHSRHPGERRQGCRAAVDVLAEYGPTWRLGTPRSQRYARLERCEPVLRGHSPRVPPLADRSGAIPEPSVTVRRNAIICGPEELSRRVQRTHYRSRDRDRDRSATGHRSPEDRGGSVRRRFRQRQREPPVGGSGRRAQPGGSGLRSLPRPRRAASWPSLRSAPG